MSRKITEDTTQYIDNIMMDASVTPNVRQVGTLIKRDGVWYKWDGGAPDEAKIIDDNTAANKTFIAVAPAGSAASASVWKVKVIDESGDYPVIKWADGDTDYNNAATALSGLTYV